MTSCASGNAACTPFCPVNATLRVLGGKWKLPILWYLQDGTRRYSELQKQIGDITPKMLAQELRDLEHDGIVSRKVYAVVPPKVEYSLTSYGRTLRPLLEQMGSWGSRHVRREMTSVA